AFAGTLNGNVFEGCVNGENSVTISATANGDSNVPAGYSIVYVLTQGEGLVIVNAGAEPSFDVMESGSYTIHTLVYDSNTLDLNIVQPGVTTGFDVNGLLIQGGGEICASLDVTGAAFTVEICPVNALINDELQLTAWPSPTNQFLNVETSAVRDDRTEFTVLSMQGKVVIPTTVMPASQRMVIDVQNLRAGQYMIRVVSGDKVATERFMRMD
ncbi:MAG: T9SS type A sorting domain-containing protein, partial [Flavobacteriales bacterium]